MAGKLQFEWNKLKRETNLDKHGLDFADARTLFTFGHLRVASVVEKGEERVVGFGFFYGRLTYVVYVWREARIRLISWRKANDREKEAYEAKTADWERFKAP